MACLACSFMSESTHLSRRHALALLGAAGAGAAATPLLGTTAAAATVGLRSQGASSTPVQGLHLSFGRNPARQMVVSWITGRPVDHPLVSFGTLAGGLGDRVDAESVVYVDGTSGRSVYVHHATLQRLRPDTSYLYAAQHDGAAPDAGTFRTAPTGRAPFTFTSFGDQATPELSWAPDGTVGLDANSAPASKDTVTGIEQIGPLFHLLNGDLCYANLDVDRVRTWNNFFTNNTRSARFRPWMPAAGNHEIERGNGPIGFGAYQTYFRLPSAENGELADLWYAFTVGSVRFIVLQNDDLCLQDGGDVYVHGYSGGRQLRLLMASAPRPMRRSRQCGARSATANILTASPLSPSTRARARADGLPCMSRTTT